MRKHLTVLTFGLLTALAAPGYAKGQPFTIEDLFSVKSVVQTAVSPDGTAIAYRLSSLPNVVEGERNGVAVSQVRIAFGAGDDRLYASVQKNPSNLAWRSSGVLTFLAEGEGKKKALYAVETSSGAVKELYSFGASISDYAFANDGATLFFSVQDAEDSKEKELRAKGFDANVIDEDARFTRLYRVDLIDAGAKAIALDLPGNVSAFDVSPDGRRVVVALAETPLVAEDLDRIYHIVDGRSGKIQSRIETAGEIDVAAFSPDGTRIALLAGIDRHDPIAHTVAVAESASGEFEFLTDGDAADELDFVWIDNGSLRVLAHRGTQSEAYTLSVDGKISNRQRHDGFVVTTLDGAAGTYAASASAPTHPPALYVAHNSGAFEKWTHHNSWLAHRDLGYQRVVEWPARDGQRIQGVLITPRGLAPRGGWPAIVVVHGGPDGHRSNNWLTEYSEPGHIAVGEGYAVLYPNYRGSSGRGQAFAKLNHPYPPAVAFNDIVDGVDYLVRAGVAKREKVGITGGSYGGYASAWGATAFSEHFAAAVIFCGLTDLISFEGTTDIPEEFVDSQFQVYPEEAWNMYLEQSPVYHAAKSKTPTLILHGEADSRVHPSQSLELFRYLKRVGQAPVRLVTYPGEPHGNQKAASRYDYALRLMQWMNHYLKGQGGATPPADLPAIKDLGERRALIDKGK